MTQTITPAQFMRTNHLEFDTDPDTENGLVAKLADVNSLKSSAATARAAGLRVSECVVLDNDFAPDDQGYFLYVAPLN